MRLRSIASGAALVMVFGSVSVGAVQADTPPATTLYVANFPDSGCNDTGPGTEAEPFCTIQAAANVASAGQTVLVGLDEGNPLYTQDVTITRSGTPGNPIIFQAGEPWKGWSATTMIEPYDGNQLASNAFVLSGVHDIVIQGFGISGATGAAISIANSSDIAVEHDIIQSDLNPGPPPIGVAVSGTSSNVTISRDLFRVAGPAVEIGSGASNAVVSTNLMEQGDSGGEISVTGASDTDITSNSWFTQCQADIAVSDSTTTTIENNDIEGDCLTAETTAEITVDADSAPTTSLDYNIPCARVSKNPVYSWAGALYTAATALDAATGQGSHDLNVSPGELVLTAAAIDSADANAPGELPTDILGNARIDDPMVPNTGTGVGYDDRGAIEQQDIMSVGVSLNALQAPTGGTVTASVDVSNAWSADPASSVDFGDGSTPVVVSGDGSSASHVYTTPGDYTVTVTSTDGTGRQATASKSITVVSAVTPKVNLVVTSGGPATAVANTNGSVDGWNITDAVIDYGDGTSDNNAYGTDSHSYLKAGTYTVSATIYDAGGNTLTASAAYTTEGSDFTPYGPVRLLDTRSGAGTGGKIARVPSQGIVKLQVAGIGSIPSGVTAVALNLTATDTSGSGFVTAYADGTSTPNVSDLNYASGRTVPNAIIVPVGTDGKIDLFNGGGSAGAIDLIGDVTGYFTQSAASGYTALSPDRLLDTRSGTGTGGVVAKVPAGKSITLSIDGADGGSLPTSGITAVALNVTTTNTVGSGFITVSPDGAHTPNVSNLNYVPNETVANAVIVPVGQDGKIDLFDGGASAGSVDLIADVTGYFSSSGTGAYVPVTPTRLLDTRNTAPLGKHATISVSPNISIPGWDAIWGATSYVVNTTVTQPTGTGFVTAFPDGEAVPDVSTLNYTPNLTIANLALVSPSSSNHQVIDFYNGGATAGSIQLIVDVFGYFGQ